MWTIKWAIAELVYYPKIQRKLRELDTILGKKPQITEADTTKFPYL